MSITHAESPQWAKVGQTYIIIKAFLYALVLTIDELRKSILLFSNHLNINMDMSVLS